MSTKLIKSAVKEGDRPSVSAGRLRVFWSKAENSIYNLPLDWANPQELRGVTELLDSKEQSLKIASLQDWQKSPSSESSTSITSPNIDLANSGLDLMEYYTSTSAHSPANNRELIAQSPEFVKKSDKLVPCKPSDVAEVAESFVRGNSDTPISQHEVLEELTYDEERLRHHLELRVEKAFYEAGKALADLRNQRLYRSTHKTFESYCRDRFEFTHRHVNYLVAGSQVVENLQMGTIGSQILPTRERQVRPLVDLEPDLQCEIWQQAVESAGGKVPSGRVVQGIVERLKAKPLFLVKDFCQVGDVFVLTRLEAKEKKYNGCPCVATHLNDFTVIVDVHDTELTVKPDNLDKIDLPEVKQQLPQILKRIRRVRQVPQFGDRVADTVLEHLGRQTYLTPLEDRILQLIEQECGAEDIATSRVPRSPL